MGDDGNYDARLKRMNELIRYARADVTDMPDMIYGIQRYVSRLDYSYGEPDEMRELEEAYAELRRVRDRVHQIALDLKAKYG